MDYIFNTGEGGEMKVNRERYQHGSVRKVPRSQGFAWEFRFYITAPDGKRKLKVQTFDSVKYLTERDVRMAVEGQLSALNAGTLGGKVAATLGTIIDRYMTDEFPALRHSTQTTIKSLINLHIKPKWQDVSRARRQKTFSHPNPGEGVRCIPQQLRRKDQPSDLGCGA
jgi:hypothetical protein